MNKTIMKTAKILLCAAAACNMVLMPLSQAAAARPGSGAEGGSIPEGTDNRLTPIILSDLYAIGILNEEFGLTWEEEAEILMETNAAFAESNMLSAFEFLVTMHNEMNANQTEDAAELASERDDVLNSNGRGRLLLKQAAKGDIFYTPSRHIVNHGHCGIYYSSGVIVEATAGERVRSRTLANIGVRKGAVIKSVNTTQANRNKAANWAYSRVNIDKYSFNFATNRKTSHYGAKNCSKLVWSAYKVTCSLDIDKNKGWGVYPKDIKNDPKTTLKYTIK